MYILQLKLAFCDATLHLVILSRFPLCYILHCSIKKRAIITPYILLFTLVFNYADITLCMTLSAQILILVNFRNCVFVTISDHEPFRANFLFNVKLTWRTIQKM